MDTIAKTKSLPGETQGQLKSKDLLGEKVRDEVTKMFEGILDFAQVAVPSPEVLKNYRARVLRLGNNCIRNIQKELSRRYLIEFVPDTEDVVIVERKKPNRKKD